MKNFVYKLVWLIVVVALGGWSLLVLLYSPIMLEISSTELRMITTCGMMTVSFA